MSSKTIVVLIASVRDGRKSDRVAKYFGKLLEGKGANVDMVDLKELDFPLFKERLKHLKDPGEKVLGFARQIKNCDGVVIVTPEYNGGYPASLKNVTDLLYDEWKRKPIAISTVSSGAFAGSQVITSLLFTLWKIGAWVIPAMCPVPVVEKTFDDNGVPAEPEAMNRRAGAFIDELFFAIDAQRALSGK
jgi:NAD(P)H-dependent FMN reductase